MMILMEILAKILDVLYKRPVSVGEKKNSYTACAPEKNNPADKYDFKKIPATKIPPPPPPTPVISNGPSLGQDCVALT